MGKHQLIIDNQAVDVYREVDVLTVVSYMISEINDIETRSNVTTKTIKLPGTARNKKIFGFADDLNVSDFKGQNVSLLGTIREDGTDIITGVVNLNNVTRNNGEVVFNITIIGNSGEWVEAMKSNRLLGIDLSYTHLKTSANIMGYFETSRPYAYALINYGFCGGQVEIKSIEDNGYGWAKCMLDKTNTVYGLRTNFILGERVMGWMFNNSSYNVTHVIDAIGTIEDGVEYFTLHTAYTGDSSGLLRSIKGNVVIEERPLVLNVRAVLIKLFALAGYTITSTFIDSAFFKRVFLLPGSEKHTQDFVTLNATKVGRAGDMNYAGVSGSPFPFDLEIKNDAGMYSLGTHKFTATEAMHGIFTVQFKIKGSAGYKVWADFVVNNVPVQMNRSTTQLVLEEANYQIFSQEAELRLQAGDYVTVRLIMPVIGGDPGNLTVSKDETFWNCAISDKIIKGSTIVPGNFLPDITQLEFIQAIRHSFNLYFLTDVNMKTVYIEPRDSFYKSNKTIDLTAKLDIGRDIIFEELGSDFTKSLAFKFKQDTSDWGVQQWEKANETRYSTYVATILNKFCKDGETVIENPLFAATLMAAFPAIGLSSMLPKIWQQPAENDTYPEKLDKYEPRLLYCADTRACLTGETWLYEGSAQNSYLLFCSKDSETVNDNSLLFDPSALDLELYSKHYANYIRTINGGRKITAYFKLSALDVQALMTIDPSGVNVKDFRSLVYFRHRGDVTNCRLDSVQEYSPGANVTTKVVLVTDVDNTFNSQILQALTMEFINNTTTLPQNYTNGCIRLASYNWPQCQYQAYGSGVYNNTQYGIGSSQGAGAPYSIERAFLYFQTNALPDACTILEAYLDIYKLDGNYNQEVTLFQGTQADILTIKDYSHFGTTPFGSTNAGNLGFRRIRLNAAGLAAINKTAVTKFCLRESYFDVQNIPPTTVNKSFRTYFTAAPQTYINKLTVKYTV